MLTVRIKSFEDLTEEEKTAQPDNGAGKEYASYLEIKHNEETIAIESDAMEPEDATFGRDLSWIAHVCLKCYELGKNEK